MSTSNDDFDRPFDQPEEDPEPLQWSVLRKLCRTSVEHFAPDQNESSVRIKAALLLILDQLDELQPLYNEIVRFAPHFDFDEETPGNGYRSFLSMVDKCILHSEQICRQMYHQKDSMFSRKNHHMKEIEACSQLLVSLQTFLQYLKILYSWSTEVMSDGKLSLFILDHNVQEFLHWTENINQYCFYGRCVGFQYGNSLKKVLKTIGFAMVSYSEMYYNNDTILGRCANSIKYFLDPEARARRIVNISQYADISFTQAFWFLNELEILSIVKPSLAINQLISIPPEELILPTLDGGIVSIPIPNSHIGKKPIHVRLLSSKRRIGMVGSGGIGGELHGLCDRLIIHTHGGGFVAQTSRSHEMYLHNWATTLGVPILSIDYSLAPEAPYPRALEEVVYAYAWALKHASTLLGSTAEKVIFVGDSAGGNLNLGAILKCLQLNIKRPDGIFIAYAPIFIDIIPSPSRMLCLTDSLLPFGFMVRCLKAYVGSDNKKSPKAYETEECAKSDTESFAEVSESDLIALALSPNGDGANGAQKLVSLPSDSTLNSVSLTEVDGIEGPKAHVEPREYISRFLNMYRNSGTASVSSPVVENGSVSRDGNVSGQSDKSWSLFGWSLPGRNNKDIRQLDMKSAKPLWEEFTIPKDLFLSPYLASDDMLAHLPPMKILTVEFDPCLDDCVMFARKLRSLGNKVTLDILPDLPHGFFNFLHVSKEAMEGVEFSAKRIKELLELEP